LFFLLFISNLHQFKSVTKINKTKTKQNETNKKKDCDINKINNKNKNKKNIHTLTHTHRQPTLTVLLSGFPYWSPMVEGFRGEKTSEEEKTRL